MKKISSSAAAVMLGLALAAPAVPVAAMADEPAGGTDAPATQPDQPGDGAGQDDQPQTPGADDELEGNEPGGDELEGADDDLEGGPNGDDLEGDGGLGNEDPLADAPVLGAPLGTPPTSPDPDPSTPMVVSEPTGTSSIRYDLSTGLLVLEVTDVACPTGVEFVSVGVSAPGSGAQWYKLEKTGESTWSKQFDPGEFGWKSGTYRLSTSICDLGWAGVDLGSTSCEVSFGTSVASAELTDDLSAAVLTVSGGRVASAWGVAFEVTSARGTFWMAAAEQADGSWSTTVPVSKLGSGSFTANAWANVESAPSSKVASAKGTVAAAKATASIAYDETLGKLVLRVEDVVCPSGVEFVSVGASAPGRSATWYKLAEQADGSWQVEIDPSDFGWKAGTYTLDVSICDLSWTGVSAGTTTSSVAFGESALTALTDPANGTVLLTAKGGAIPAASNLAFMIVEDGSKGHTGTSWYQAYRQSDGSWTATVKASSIGSGTCVAQTVATIGGSNQYLEKTGFHIGEASATVTVGSLTDEGTVAVVVSDLTSTTGVSKVHIDVTCGNETHRYTCTEGLNDTWIAITSLGDLDFASGTYSFTAVVEDEYGSEIETSTASKGIEVPAKAMSARSSSGDGATIDLCVSGGATAYAWGVAFAMYDADGSTTWLAATQQADGSWTASVAANSLAGSGTVSAYANVGSSSHYVTACSYDNRVAMLKRVQGYSSPTGYLVATDSTGCRTGVYTGYRGNWKELYYWECSPGAPGTPTAKGTFSVSGRGYYFVSFGSWCYYYTQFYGDYLFHSTTYNADGSVQDDRLGLNLSHGCVRLHIDNAKWIYDNIPYRTTVVSY